MNVKQPLLLLAGILAANIANAQLIFIIKQRDNTLLVLESDKADKGEIRICTANVGQKVVPCIKTVPNEIERDEKGIKPYNGVAYHWNMDEKER